MKKVPARVLYIQRPRGGGSLSALIDMIASLDRGRFDPHVLLWESGPGVPKLESAGAGVHLVDVRPSLIGVAAAIPGAQRMKSAFSNLRQTNRLVRRTLPESRRWADAIREVRPGIVHHNDTPSTDRASIIAAARLGLPQVCHVRNYGNYFPMVDRWLSRSVSHYVFVSEAIREHFGACSGVSADRGETVYESFDFDGLSIDAEHRRLVREDLGLPMEAPVVTSMGRVVRWKGQDVFLRAMQQVVKENPTAMGLIVGAPGEDADSQRFASELRDLAGSVGLTDRVVFAGLRDDVPAVLAASDIVVHSATTPEPFGRVPVEAMAAGKPVVATGAGGILEIIEDSQTGLLVMPGDDAALAEAIQNLLTDSEKAHRIGAAGAASVRERFTRHAFSGKLSEIYDRLAT